MDAFDLLEELIYEIKKRYRIWKNGCKKCDLFDECFDYLDGKRCFIKEQKMENKINKIIDFFIKQIEKEECKGDMDIIGLLMSVRDKEVVIELFKDINKVDTIKFDKQELLSKIKEQK